MDESTAHPDRAARQHRRADAAWTALTTTRPATTQLGLLYYFYPNAVDPTHSTFCSTDTCQLEDGFISSTNGGRTWSNPQTLAGPMNLRWLPLTTQGFMVGDYLPRRLFRHDDGSSAFPIFMVASKPTVGDRLFGRSR